MYDDFNDKKKTNCWCALIKNSVNILNLAFRHYYSNFCNCCHMLEINL